MLQTILTAPCVNLKELNHLFIELTSANCNLRCKHCYLEFNPYKKIKDFIPVDKVKKTIYDTKDDNLKCIYLTGGEPMLHPHFNTILRMCLKRCATTIFTNGTLINDKKARFLRKVENETTNELIVKLSLDDYREAENDELRGRGNFRKVLFAVQSLIKYEFNPILSIVNYNSVDERYLIEQFKATFKKIDIELEDINFSIVPLFDKNRQTNEKYIENADKCTFDCSYSRTLTNNGVYTCPLLTSDERGRSGSSFEDYSKRNFLETEICSQCAKNGKNLFINSWM